MPTNYTQNYHLSQWEPEDKVLRTDFNADNAKIDRALQAEADTRAAEMAALAAQVAAKGNGQIYVTSYVGTDTYGANAAKSVSFPGRPLVVLIGDGGSTGYTACLIRGQRMSYACGVSTAALVVNWGERSVSWSNHVNATGHLNVKGVTYNVVALMEA